MALKQEFLFQKFARDYYFIQFNFFPFFCPNNVLISWKTLLCAYDFLENIVLCLSFPEKHCYVPVISWKTLLCAYDFLESIVMCLWFLGKHWYVPMISWKALLCACDFLENIVCLWYDTRDSAPSLLAQKENKSKTAQGGLWVFLSGFWLPQSKHWTTDMGRTSCTR